MSVDGEILAALARLEAMVGAVDAKLDALIQALADEDDDDPPRLTLDGDHAGGARDQGQSLG